MRRFSKCLIAPVCALLGCSSTTVSERIRDDAGAELGGKSGLGDSLHVGGGKSTRTTGQSTAGGTDPVIGSFATGGIGGLTSSTGGLQSSNTMSGGATNAVATGGSHAGGIANTGIGGAVGGGAGTSADTTAAPFAGTSSIGGAATGGAVASGGVATTLGGANAGGVFSGAGGTETTDVLTGGAANGGAATGGAATGGVATGGAATGGAATGGAATGGAATGGAATGGAATGGAATGGAATGGAASTFRGGPCVVSTNGTSIEVFARGNDKKIYRKTVNGTTQSKWANLVDLDGSLIDNRSDLDCSATSTKVHIVALGQNPAGAVLHATGLGTAYNSFSRELPTKTFSPTPSITTGSSAYPDDFRLGTLSGGSWLQVGEMSSGTYSDLGSVPVAGSSAFNSSPDLAYMPSTSSNSTFVVAFDTTNQLTIGRYLMSSSSEWLTPPLQMPAPTGTLYQYTPTVCAGPGQGGSGSSAGYYVYLAVVAGDRVWATYNRGFPTEAFTGWLQSGTDAATAPDCVITSGDDVMHIVTLSSSGSALLYEGKAGGPFTKTDLGVY